MTDAKKTEAEAPAAAVAPDGQKLCHVLKNGAGKIAKGFAAVDADGHAREQFYDKGEDFIVAAEIADALEDRGFVET
jgi:hypothetical protein